MQFCTDGRCGGLRNSQEIPFMIPRVDIAALFGPPSSAREAADPAIMAAAEDIGFLTVAGLPQEIPHGAEVRRDLLRIFALPPSEIRKLWRQKFDPARPNVYRGWFPLQDGHATYKEGIDMGPDVAYGAAAIEPGDILREETPSAARGRFARLA